MNNVAQEKMTEIVEKLISKIENNETGLWSKSWISGGGLPSNYSSKTTYSGFNILSLMFMIEEENWSSNQFLTFNQIRKIKGAKYNTPRKQHKKNQYLIPKELKYKDYFKG